MDMHRFRQMENLTRFCIISFSVMFFFLFILRDRGVFVLLTLQSIQEIRHRLSRGIIFQYQAHNLREQRLWIISYFFHAECMFLSAVLNILQLLSQSPKTLVHCLLNVAAIVWDGLPFMRGKVCISNQGLLHKQRIPSFLQLKFLKATSPRGATIVHCSYWGTKCRILTFITPWITGIFIIHS